MVQTLATVDQHSDACTVGASYINAGGGGTVADSSALHDEVNEVLVVDVALRVLLALQQLLHLRIERTFKIIKNYLVDLNYGSEIMK